MQLYDCAFIHAIVWQKDLNTKKIKNPGPWILEKRYNKCASTSSAPKKGTSTLDYEVLGEENFHLIRNITVDLKFTDTKVPVKKCKFDETFLQLGKEFKQKYLTNKNETTS